MPYDRNTVMRTFDFTEKKAGGGAGGFGMGVAVGT